jgi:hypothetical protein
MISFGLCFWIFCLYSHASSSFHFEYLDDEKNGKILETPPPSCLYYSYTCCSACGTYKSISLIRILTGSHTRPLLHRKNSRMERFHTEKKMRKKLPEMTKMDMSSLWYDI